MDKVTHSHQKSSPSEFSPLIGTAMRDADEAAERVLEYREFLERKAQLVANVRYAEMEPADREQSGFEWDFTEVPV